ncbi:MAG: PQQ-binding-like beta-propeller repeat protein [Planctomycetaceae bacterium]
MTSESVVKEPDLSSGPPARFPRILLPLTGVCVFAGLMAAQFVSELEDRFSIGLDAIVVASIVVVAGLILCWAGWFLFLSRWRWSYRILAVLLLLALPPTMLKLFRPIHGGDANIMGFEPFWNRREEMSPPAATPAPSTVDLLTETPDDFPQFLGIHHDSAVHTNIRIDSERFGQTEIVWKQPVGAGWSAFSARNGNAVTMEQRGDQECVTCYRIDDGTLQWCYQHAARHQDAMNLGRVGPRSTPTIHNGNVYAVGAVGNLVCLNGADGTVRWQADLNSLLGIELETAHDADGFEVQYEKNTSLSWGRSGSPLIVDDLVVIPGGGPRGATHTLVAFDSVTGDVRWMGGQFMIGYGSPVLETVAGVRQILMVTEADVAGFDPATGDVLWSASRPGESNGGANTSQVNVISANEILTTKGYPDGGGDRIRLVSADGHLHAETVWKSDRILKTKLMSPVIFEGHTYAFSNGFLECARLDDGERIWKHRGRFGHGQLLRVGEEILLHSESGELLLMRASPEEFIELGRMKTIDGVCWNTLCLAGGFLLVRSEVEAACLKLPVREPM